MIENILEGVIVFGVIIFSYISLFCELTFKGFIIISLMFFGMLITLLIMGKYMFGVW